MSYKILIEFLLNLIICVLTYLNDAITVPRVLFHLSIEKNYSAKFSVLPLYHDFYRLFIKTSEDHWVPRCYLFFKLIKHVFLLTAAFN